jgi:3-oxoacyl-[acyl-carrier protein] reductase
MTTWLRLNNLAGKVAVITGGSGQVGYATAIRLAEQQCRVVMLVRSKLDEAKEMALKLPFPELNHFALPADITDTASVIAAEQQVRQQAGRCDILVNAAGITTRGRPDLPMTDEMFDMIVTNNLRGTYSVIRTFMSLLKESGDALIVNISSTAAQRSSPSNIAYASSKAGVDLMTTTLGRALAPDKIRVVGVIPGYMIKSTSGLVKDPGFNEKVASPTMVPLARIGYADDIASTIEAFATHIRFATGVSLLVDGGRTV